MHSGTSLRGDARNRPDEGEADFSSEPPAAEYVSSDGSFARIVSVILFGDFDGRLC